MDRVDKWKIKAAGEYRRSVSDREALAHLLYEAAPPSVRRELETALRGYYRQADTKHQQRRALPRAVEDVEGERLAWWVKRLSYHRSRLAAMTRDAEKTSTRGRRHRAPKHDPKPR